MARIFFLIWIAALTLAGAFILLLLSVGRAEEVQYPPDFTSAMSVDIVFIGSSLAGTALPATELMQGTLGDGRSSAILSVEGIPECLTTRLLTDAIDSGAKTIFLEINAYAHDYVFGAEPAFVNAITRAMREAGEILTLKIRVIFNFRTRVVRFGAMNMDGTFDPKQLRPIDYYRFKTIEPTYGDELQAQLARAKKANVEVFFFSPPRPQSAINVIGNDEFADLQSHMNNIAAFYDLPLWYSPIPWPDDHFMDIMAHANARGRFRFRKELSQWYEAMQ